MLKRPDFIHIISQKLAKEKHTQIVLDPVMVSTSGHSLIDDDAKQALTAQLFPLTDLITPNIPEAATLLGKDEDWVEKNVHLACKEMLDQYQLKAVLLKGGHMQGDYCIDTLAIKNPKSEQTDIHIFKNKKIDTVNSHGTGCSLSSAIAAYLAQGLSLKDSVESASHFLQKALKDSEFQNVGNGHGPINHRSGASTYLLVS